MASDVDVVKAVFEAFARRDLDALVALVHPDVEFHAQTADLAGRTEPYRGLDGMRRYFADVEQVWEEIRLTPREFRMLDDSVLVTGRVYARSQARIVDGSTGWIFRVREGRMTYGYVYGSAEEAEEAARSGE